MRSTSVGEENETFFIRVWKSNMNHEHGISIPQGPITRTRAKKLQQTLYTYIQAMVRSSKEILEDIGDLPYML